jgi:hypothetical protein
LRAAALPPFRPAAFFWAVVPPCFELLVLVLVPDFFAPSARGTRRVGDLRRPLR